MYDFIKFIEILNTDDKQDSIKNALNSIKDVFHFAKIVAESKPRSYYYEYTIDEYKPDYVGKYSNKDIDYYFYQKKDSYIYTEEEIKDIKMILSIISLHHEGFLSNQKAKENELISPNTQIPNAQGYIKKVMMLNCDYRNYNSYYINIKGFGLINKIYGSAEGDKAIVSYARALSNFIDKDEVVGHLGGDNFSATIKRSRHQDFIDLVTMCPVEVSNDGVRNIVNLIGVVGYKEIDSEKTDYGSILSDPSIACQYARTTKKIVVKLTNELLSMVNDVKQIERTFKEELANGNFVVYYQPKFDIKSGKIIGVEALTRWMNNGKLVPPGMFIPVLETNGEIVDLDLYVLETLCKDIHNYRNQGYNIVPASCNISRRDLEVKDIENKIINIIRKYNVFTRDIVIEVTETTNLEENARLSKFIEVMHENGIMTSVDDFGTGYSSLSVLRDFKVNEIKIDRSFINRDILNDSDEIIIGSIIDMAKRLKIDVICEGVENEEQAEFLLRLGCKNAQGFLYSKPLPKLEFEALMQKIGTVYY
jgi:EAL domain-containing protein (putative c-di-GMP-specific phosphodiesterase class I)